MKSLVIGNFGYRKKQLDGQTVKTRLVYSSLKKLCNVSIIDVGGVNPFISILKILLFVPFCKTIYFLPGKKQLLFLSPILIFYKCIFSLNIHYIVVGGWIEPLIFKKIYIRYLIKWFNSINVEVPSIVKSLQMYGYKAKLLTNFRVTDGNVAFENADEDLKFIYFSRVMREKGIFEAIGIIEMLNLKGKKNVSLNIYGPLTFILKEDERLFLERVDLIGNIYFHGTLQPRDVCRTISKYDYLIFPTTYHGEGVPGCIIDAKISGVATICTDWKYNSEVIDNGIDGMLFNSKTFITDTFTYIENISRFDVDIMKEHAKSSSRNYTETAFLNWFDSL